MSMTAGPCPSPEDLRAFIEANLPLAAVPAIPEICLHLARPSSGLRRLAEMDEDGFGTPYWAFPWPGGLALARHILDRPEVVVARRVLDLGAGSGIVAIAAAKAGARTVAAADIDRYAIVALDLNAAANGVDVEIVPRDLTAGEPPQIDLVLVGDLFYKRGLALRVTRFLDRCLTIGADVLIGDIGRPFLPKDRLRRVAAYPVAEFGAATGRGQVCAVYAFETGRGQNT